MAVRAQKRLAGNAEALEMDLMADSVSGLGVMNAELRIHRLKVAVVVRIFKSHLKSVVIDVRNRDIGLHTRNSHRFELEIRHGSGRVLRQSLVDADADLLPDGEFSFDAVFAEYFVGECFSHDIL